jgi:uncharacterized protein (TIRG00374 family)
VSPIASRRTRAGSELETGVVTDGEHTPDDSAAVVPVSTRLRKTFGRMWPVLRYVLGLGIVALAVWVLASHTDELSGFSGVVGHLAWYWVVMAVVLEALSFACFAQMQRDLLRCGGLQTKFVSVWKLTYAAQALANSLPGGPAISAVYGFRWFRRFGADSVLAAWSAVGTLIAAAVSLSLIATAGLVLATSEGASFDLIPAIIGTLLVTVAVGALFIYERPLFRVVSATLNASHAIIGRPRGDTSAQIDRIMRSITSVRVGWRQLIRIVLWGTANWLFDCGCFALMFLAIHSSIPWKGLLLAYGAGQLATALPITPGGLGAVEGSITIALVEFGGAQTPTVDAVLLYRLVSFWLVLLVGWLLCGEMALEVRRGRWNRQALAAPISAGLGSDPAGVTVPVQQPGLSEVSPP